MQNYIQYMPSVIIALVLLLLMVTGIHGRLKCSHRKHRKYSYTLWYVQFIQQLVWLLDQFCFQVRKQTWANSKMVVRASVLVIEEWKRLLDIIIFFLFFFGCRLFTQFALGTDIGHRQCDHYTIWRVCKRCMAETKTESMACPNNTYKLFFIKCMLFFVSLLNHSMGMA